MCKPWQMRRHSDRSAGCQSPPIRRAQRRRTCSKASVPFGAGARLCPGRYLAMLEMKMVLATIARNFEQVQVTTPDGSPPKERLAFAMSPIGLNLKLARRDLNPT